MMKNGLSDSDVYIGGSSATAVMMGNGGEVREAWPASNYVWENLTFGSENSLSMVPVSGFDGRSSSSSAFLPGLSSGGVFYPQVNAAHTHQYRLFDRTYTGKNLAIETVITVNPKPLVLPSILIVACDEPSNQLVGVEFGNNGVRFISLNGATWLYQHTIPTTITGGDVLRVVKFGHWIEVYLNGVKLGATSHPSFDLVGRPGVGLYSSSGTNQSTPIGNTTFHGSTNYGRDFQGVEWVTRGKLAHNLWTSVAKMWINPNRNMNILLENALWSVSTSDGSYQRPFAVFLNGTQIGITSGQNGGSFWVNNVFVPANSLIEVGAASNAVNAAHRVVADGRLKVYPT